MMKIKWIKVCANAGVAFFSTLSSLLTFNALVASEIPKEVILPASLLVAVIQGGLSLCKEIHEQAEQSEMKCKQTHSKGSMKIDIYKYLTIW